MDANLKASQQARDLGSQAHALATRFMLAMLLSAALLTLVLALRIVNSVTRPLGALRQAIVSIDQNRDFTKRADVFGQDETGQTIVVFNTFLDEV